MLPFIKPDFGPWTWEGDDSDDVEDYDSINVDMDSSSVGTEGGGLLKQVFPLRIGSHVFGVANNSKSQINPQPRPA